MPPFLSAECGSPSRRRSSSPVWARGFRSPRVADARGLLARVSSTRRERWRGVWGEQTSPPDSLPFCLTYPLFVLLVAHFAIGAERITVRKAVGVALGSPGVGIFRPI